MSQKSCGECTACCYALGVRELMKPSEHPCGFQLHPADRDGQPPSARDRYPPQRVGCSVYEMRPAECRAFECLWLQAEADDESGFRVNDQRTVSDVDAARPDRIGVVLTGSRDDSDLGSQVIIAYEAWPGSFHEQRAARFLAELAKTQIVYLAVGNARGVIGPPDKLRLVKGHVEEKIKRRLPVIRAGVVDAPGLLKKG